MIIDDMIEFLNTIQQHKGMYIGDDDRLPIGAIIAGMHYMHALVDIKKSDTYDNTRQAILERYQLDHKSPMGPEFHLLRRGLSREEVTEILIEIERSMWEQGAYCEPGQPS